MSFGFFADAGLTIPFTAGLRHFSTQGDRLIYFGSAETGKQLQNSTSPGSAQVQVVITDSASGSGLAASSIKLASTSGGLTSATGGAALALGTTVLSGAGNAKPIHIRFDTSGGTVGTDYTDLGLAVNDVIEAAV